MALTARDSALITLTEAKIWMEHDPADTSKDDHWNALIGMASEWVGNYCNRAFTQQTHTEYYDGKGAAHLYLNHWPVTSPLSDVSGGVWVDAAREFAASSQLTEEILGSSAIGDYIIRPGEEGMAKLIRLTGGAWPCGTLNIKVVYEAGYATIPNAVKRATFRLVGWMNIIDERRLHAQVSEAIQAGGGSLTLVPHKIAEDIEDALYDFRLSEY